MWCIIAAADSIIRGGITKISRDFSRKQRVRIMILCMIIRIPVVNAFIGVVLNNKSVAISRKEVFARRKQK